MAKHDKGTVFQQTQIRHDDTTETTDSQSAKSSTTASRKDHPHEKRFDTLAKNQGWTSEDLRKCSDVPKKLAVGSRIIRMPPNILEVLDPFKNEPMADPEHEYDVLETRFYNILSKFVATGGKRRKGAKVPQSHIRIKITGDEDTNGIRFNITKQAVDATFTFHPKSKKS